MKINRRSFLKSSAIVGTSIALSDFGISVSDVKAATKDFKLTDSKEYTSICTYCACGCGVVCYVKDGKLINLEGDSDHVVNEGSLCSKGASMSVIPNSEERVKKPLYRAPGSNSWVEISWEEAIDKVAKKIKSVRDKNWISVDTEGSKRYPANRCEQISFIGSAQVNNEECYLMAKMARLLGVTYLEHQARLCHSSTVPALSASFGRGAMTNSWNDLKNAKVILIEGSNAAENHPMSMKWVMRAKANGAKVISVDPRFTRTSKIADLFAQIRPGTDIAFLGAIINYILLTNSYDESFLKNHTNAGYILRNDFEFSEGIFSGYSEKSHAYDKTSWSYKLNKDGKPLIADDLNNPNTVLSNLRKFYDRYTFTLASSITGIPEDTIKEIALILINNRPGTVMYALGMTQHTVGVQNIRSFGVMQLLLGNVGKPGSGINALRGEPNVQGSTDFALLHDYLPGYLPYPTHNHTSIDKWCESYGNGRRKYLVSLLKSWFGDNATADNDYGFNWLPKKDPNKNYSIYRIFESSIEDNMRFAYIMGQNPMVTNPNLNVVFEGLSKLDMLVVADPFITETAAFWEKPGVDPKDIMTEVVLLPAASFLEKDGTLINSSRMVQWRYTDLKPVGEAKSDLEIIDTLFSRIRELYKGSSSEQAETLINAKWSYPKDNMFEYVLKEINGYNLYTNKLVNKIGDLKEDGSTSSGNWVYAGVFGNGINNSKRRDHKTDPSGLGLYPNFSWTWPSNIRILYNRASCDELGRPYDNENKLIWWDSSAGKWSGYDIPDTPTINAAPHTSLGQRAFRMSAEGVGRLFAASHKVLSKDGEVQSVSSTPADGPIPEFYEPVESPTQNILHPDVAINPCLIYPRLESMQVIGDKKNYPYVLCTSSITEHWCGGTYTRNVPWLNELVKETYIEIPYKLANKLNIGDGDNVKVSSARGIVEVKAMLTNRIQTLNINGEEVVVVWMPYNWGFKGLSTAASTNLLTIDAGDPNTWIQETKACLVNVEKV